MHGGREAHLLILSGETSLGCLRAGFLPVMENLENGLTSIIMENLENSCRHGI